MSNPILPSRGDRCKSIARIHHSRELPKYLRNADAWIIPSSFKVPVLDAFKNMLCSSMFLVDLTQCVGVEERHCAQHNKTFIELLDLGHVIVNLPIEPFACPGKWSLRNGRGLSLSGFRIFAPFDSMAGEDVFRTSDSGRTRPAVGAPGWARCPAFPWADSRSNFRKVNGSCEQFGSCYVHHHHCPQRES